MESRSLIHRRLVRRATVTTLTVTLVAFTLVVAPASASASPTYLVTATIAVGANPAAVGVDPSTHMVYVVNGTAGTVSVINATTNKVTATITVGGVPSAVGVDSATNTVYVGGSDTVSVIDGATNTVAHTITLPLTSSGVNGIGVDPTTDTVYVAGGTSALSVIDGATDTVTATIDLDPGTIDGPDGVGVDPTTNTVYVSNSDVNTVSVIDGTTGTLTATIAVGDSPDGVGVDPTTDTVYVANSSFDHTVSVIDGATDTVTHTITVAAGANGVAVDPSTQVAYVTSSNGNNSGTVSVIDETTDTVAATVPVAGGAGAVGVDPSTGNAYVADFTGSSLWVVTPGVAPVLSADTPPTTGLLGTPYGPYTFQATGNPAPTYAVSSGVLPAGLALNPTTGVLSGTPTAVGASTFTVAASNAVSPASVSPAITVTVSGNPAALTYPANGQSGVDTTRAFTWSGVASAQAYDLVIGTQASPASLVSSKVLPSSQTSLSVPALPAGPTLLATLFTELEGTWEYHQTTFTAAPGEATFTFPANGQSGVDPTRAFTWSTIPQGQGYILVVGTTLYGTNVANSGILAPTQSSYTTPTLPAGKTLYATLLTKVNGAFTRFQAITFITGPAMGTFIHPVNGQFDVTTPGTFTWATIAGAQHYFLVVGTTVFGTNLVSSGVLPPSQSTYVVPALPSGEVLYATLLTEVNGTWTYQLIGFTVSAATASTAPPVPAREPDRPVAAALHERLAVTDPRTVLDATGSRRCLRRG